MRRFFMVVFIVFALPCLYILYLMYSSPDLMPQGEIVGPDEQVHISQIVDSGINMLLQTRKTVGDGMYRRDAHAKSHGCVIANFKVRPVEDPLRQGVFVAPKTYTSWIRFSSGSTEVQGDWQPDARGMAIKLLGVPGTKLLQGEENAHTQDFLMIDNPTFFIRTVDEYARLTKFQGENSQFAYFFQGANPFSWHWREFRIGLGILKWPPHELLGTRFYSMTAYRLGTGNMVKYSARPTACSAQTEVPGGWPSFSSTGLSQDLRAELNPGKSGMGRDPATQLGSAPVYCFDFMVQLQVPGKNMPVEDTTVEWREKDSPFVPVARIEIPKQDVSRAMDSGFCENLSMTPWHALPEHQPVGGLNRIRQAVYQGIARFRRCMNGKAFGEPIDDGSLAFDSRACDPHQAVPEVSQSR